jgi:hypothetical protein
LIQRRGYAPDADVSGKRREYDGGLECLVLRFESIN